MCSQHSEPRLLSPHCFGIGGLGGGGQGLRYLHSSKRTRAEPEVGGGGWRKKVKENKLLEPLNIHDGSFAQANRKHINPFTTLLNALKRRRGGRRMKITAGSGTSGEEYENMDHRRLAAQGRESCEFYLDPVWEVWSLGPFISHHYKKTLPQK